MIQAASHKQVPEIIELLSIQMKEHDITLSSDEIKRAVLGILDDETRGLIFVAQSNDRVVGVACLSFIWTIEHAGKSAWLEELFVLPDFRGQGLGQKLLDTAIAQTKALDCHAIDLEVDVEHGRAENLYKRNGFVRHKRSRWFRFS